MDISFGSDIVYQYYSRGIEKVLLLSSEKFFFFLDFCINDISEINIEKNTSSNVNIDTTQHLLKTTVCSFY